MTKLWTALLGSYLTLQLAGCAGSLPLWAGDGIPDGDLTDGPNAGELPQDPKLGVIRGKVVDHQGKPVEGAKVMVYKPSQAGGFVQGYRVMAGQNNWLPPVYISETTTSKDGIYQAINVPPGTVTVEIRKPEDRSALVLGSVSTAPSEAVEASVLPAVVIPPAANLKGEVVGGSKISGLVALPGTRFSASVDATTSFYFEELPTGYIVEYEEYDTDRGKLIVPSYKTRYSYQVSLERPGKPIRLSPKVEPGPGESMNITFNLGASVTGLVSAEEGVELAKVRPVVWFNYQAFPGTMDPKTGEFRVEEIPVPANLMGYTGHVRFVDTTTERELLTIIGEDPVQLSVGFTPNDQGAHRVTHPEWPVRLRRP